MYSSISSSRSRSMSMRKYGWRSYRRGSVAWLQSAQHRARIRRSRMQSVPDQRLRAPKRDWARPDPKGRAGPVEVHTYRGTVPMRVKGQPRRQRHGHHGDRARSRDRLQISGGNGCLSPIRAKAKEKEKERAKARGNPRMLE